MRILPAKPMASVAHTLLRGLLRLVYPDTCWVCGCLGAERDPLVCDPCRHTITHDPFPNCPFCSSTVGPFAHLDHGCPACRSQALGFDRAFRMGPYDGRLREVILRMKRAQGEEFAHVIARVWTSSMLPRLRPYAIDTVLPVPMHWRRHWRRGFNPSAILAQHVAAGLGAPCVPRLLRCVRRTEEQKRLAPTARRENVRGAFGVTAGASLAGKNVLLVDDVMTTGATLTEAARTLRPFAPAHIIVAVLAHGR